MQQITVSKPASVVERLESMFMDELEDVSLHALSESKSLLYVRVAKTWGPFDLQRARYHRILDEVRRLVPSARIDTESSESLTPTRIVATIEASAVLT